MVHQLTDVLVVVDDGDPLHLKKVRLTPAQNRPKIDEGLVTLTPTTRWVPAARLRWSRAIPHVEDLCVRDRALRPFTDSSPHAHCGITTRNEREVVTMMWSGWEMSWLATGLLMMIAFGGLATLIALALLERQSVETGQAELEPEAPSEVHHA